MSRATHCALCTSPNLVPLPAYRRAHLVRCSDCGFVFAGRVPSWDELVEHYDGYSRDTSFNSPVSIARRAQILESFEPFRSTGRFLDAGCGVGFLLDQAREMGWETHGTEVTDRAVEICQENGHTMHQGGLDSAPFEPGGFDVVVYSEVMEHLVDPRAEIATARRFLRPGGALYVTTPNFASLSRRLLGSRWNVIQYPEHLGYFTPRTLRRAVEAEGFDRVSLRTTGLSLTRFAQSARPERPRVERPASADEKVRTAFETSVVLGWIKRALNGALAATRTGDKITGLFRKRKDAGGSAA